VAHQSGIFTAPVFTAKHNIHTSSVSLILVDGRLMGLREEDARGKSARFICNVMPGKIEANMGQILPTTQYFAAQLYFNKLRRDG